MSIVDFPSEVTRAMSGKKVLIDRGDGHLFKVTEKRAAELLKANPRAHVVGAGRQPAPAPGRTEVETPEADSPATSQVVSLQDMTVAQLIVYADALEPPLRLPKASKTELVRLIQERLDADAVAAADAAEGDAADAAEGEE